MISFYHFKNVVNVKTDILRHAYMDITSLASQL